VGEIWNPKHGAAWQEGIYVRRVHAAMLAKYDFVVCTLTSNVGRYVCEMMQTFHVDASRRLLSLDIDYYLALGVSRKFVSVIPHDGPIGESLKRGDVIDYTPNKWRNPHMPGFIYGQNRRTKKTGFFPGYNLVEVFKRVKLVKNDLNLNVLEMISFRFVNLVALGCCRYLVRYDILMSKLKIA